LTVPDEFNPLTKKLENGMFSLGIFAGSQCGGVLAAFFILGASAVAQPLLAVLFSAVGQTTKGNQPAGEAKDDLAVSSLRARARPERFPSRGVHARNRAFRARVMFTCKPFRVNTYKGDNILE
jgi:hypothetical protein